MSSAGDDASCFVTIPDALSRAALEQAIQAMAEDTVLAAIEQARRRAVSWSYAGLAASYHRREPMYYESHWPSANGRRRPELVSTPAELPDASGEEYGLDASGQIIVMRELVGFQTEVWLSHTESVTLDPQAGIIAIRRTLLDGERMVASADIRGGYEGSNFEYLDGELDAIRMLSYPQSPPGPFTSYLTVERDSRRERGLTRRPAQAAGATELTDAQLEGAIERLTAGLVERVIELTRERALEEPVRFLSLFSGRGISQGRSQFMLQISPATVSDTDRILRRRPYKPFDLYLTFHQGGFNTEDAEDSDWGFGSLVELGAQVEIELGRRRDDHRCQAIWRELVLRLNGHDWTDSLCPTEEFVVIALLGDAGRRPAPEHLAAILDEERYARLLVAESSRAEKLAREDRDPEPVAFEDGIDTLLHELDRLGIDMTTRSIDRVPVASVWEAFLGFLAHPVVDADPLEDGDLVLIEWGAWGGPFSLGFTRQVHRPGREMEVIVIDIKVVPPPVGVASASQWFSPIDLDQLRRNVQQTPGLTDLLRLEVDSTDIEVAYSRI